MRSCFAVRIVRISVISGWKRQRLIALQISLRSSFKHSNHFTRSRDNLKRDYLFKQTSTGHEVQEIFFDLTYTPTGYEKQLFWEKGGCWAHRGREGRPPFFLNFVGSKKDVWWVIDPRNPLPKRGGGYPNFFWYHSEQIHHTSFLDPTKSKKRGGRPSRPLWAQHLLLPKLFFFHILSVCIGEIGKNVLHFVTFTSECLK